MPGSPLVRRLVFAAAWIAVSLCIVVVLRDVDWSRVVSVQLRLPEAAAALAVALSSRFLLPVVWSIALSALEGRPMGVRVLIWPYAVSWVSRYLPGRMGLVGARVLAANRYGYSVMNAFVSVGIEVILQLVLTTIISVSCLGIGLGAQLPFNAVPVLLLSALLAALISPPLLGRLVKWYVRWKKNPQASIGSVSWAAVLGCAAVLTLMYALQSGYVVLLAESMGVAARDHWAVFLGAIFLSTIAGIVAVFSPNGIGVRELVFIQILAPWYAREQLLAYAVIWRLAETAVDVMFFAAAWAVFRPSASARR